MHGHPFRYCQYCEWVEPPADTSPPVTHSGPTLAETDGRLLWLLRVAGQEWGPLGVALAAMRMAGITVDASTPDAAPQPVEQISAEQKARDLLERLGVEDAQSYSAGDLVELANMIARNEDHY